ncbi:MAG: S8 family serine peptidase [bacterium]
MRKALALATLLLVFTASNALAGHLSPGLQRLITGKPGSDEIKVLVVLQDQADIPTLNQNLHLAHAPRALRHRIVVDALRETAARSQAPLRTELASKRANGAVREFAPWWIVNAFTVTTTVDGVRELAARSDVDVIEPDLPVDLIRPVNVGKSDSGNAIDQIGIVPGIVSIGARRVWTELGINGTGALIGGLDTGVDGTHPALSARWRGHFAPVGECWRDAVGFGDTTPVDRYGHGTHTMGTMCGLAPTDTIGVAPGAQWISDNAINQSTGAAFDADIIDAFQWFADPDGNSNTLADVPDVVQNSWGVNEGFSGYVDCDTRWWVAIDNCEAAGVCVTWSAGNEGPGAQTMRSPADRATTPFNTFSVGATNPTSPFTIASFSSRGPSGCGGPYAMKPEISAPGVGIYSSVPGGGYQNMDGTSMAGPHVAGTVALMRSANPNVDVDTIKQILMDTAVDLGTPGEDNTYGHGFVNAYDAVVAVLQGYGRIEGTVTDAVSHVPLPNVVVDVLNDPRQTTSNGSGFFGIPLPAGSWTLEYRTFGYVTGTQTIQVVADQTADGSFAMTPAPAAIVSGIVRDYTSALVSGATISVLGTPIAPVLSLADGSYSISVPDGATYSMRARKDGFGSDTRSVTVSGPTTQDFLLPQLTHEDFESGDFQVWPWVMSGNAPWTIDGTNVHEGNYAAKSGTITDSQASTMQLSLTLISAGNVSFWYTVSSESGYDYLRFYIDGVQQGQWSGAVAWTQATYPIASGSHTLTWTYSKDGSVSVGSDAAWVDFIDLPPVGYAELALNPTSLSAVLQPNQTVQQPLHLQNAGTAALSFSVAVLPAPAPAPLADAKVKPPREVALDKGEKDPRHGESPLLGSGGPDAFGYRWIDSDAPGGPAYQWVEINGVGTPLSMGDDTYTASLPMGITFPWYGNSYTTLHVSTNGFVSFTSPTGTYYTNAAIPGTADPNNMVGAYWDDLNAADGGHIYTYQDVANSRFILEWDAVPLYRSGGGGPPQTFEMILNADGSVVAQYKTVSEATSATVGIENVNGTVGLQVVFNAAYLHNALAIRFSTAPLVPWLSASPLSGSVPAQGAQDVTATYNSAGLALGVYNAVLRLTTNDSGHATVDVPVTLTVSNATGVVAGVDVPTAFELGEPSPNPFGQATSIRFAVPVADRHVRIAIFDVAGRRVRTLLNAVTGVGRHETSWDGRDAAGQRVASGVYFYRMDAGDFSQVRKVTVLK